MRENGVSVNSTWIDEAGPGESLNFADLAQRCIREAAEADVVILFVEPDDHIKVALIEVGAALSHGKPVICVGRCPSISSTIEAHPLWFSAPSVEYAVAIAPGVIGASKCQS